MKKKQLIHSGYWVLLMIWAVISVSAKANPVNLYGKAAIDFHSTLIHADFVLKPTGELYVNSPLLQEKQTNWFAIAGNYTGEPGAKIYFPATLNNPVLMKISGSAKGSTEIAIAPSDDWEGSGIDLIRAKKDGSEPDAFQIKRTQAECEEYVVFLKHREEETDLVWYILGMPTLPLIVPLGNHTLLANNNPITNGGHKFVYYYWYENGQLIKEGAHETHGGSYYTGGINLNPRSEYTVEAIGSDGKHYFSCPYTFVPQNTSLNVIASPNPVVKGSVVNVAIETDDAALLNDATIDIYSYSGQLQKRIQLAGQRITSVNLPEAGVYLLEFKAGNTRKIIKVVITR